MKDRVFFGKTIGLLTNRHAFDHTLWSYSIMHNDVATANEYLQSSDSFVAATGKQLESPLLTIDPVLRHTYQHREYRPLINARAHQLGKRRQILNDRMHWQYHEFLKAASYKPKLSQEDLAAATYYLLLQDRIEEALAFYEKLNPKQLKTQLQYDYLTAYISFYKEELPIAEAIARKYENYPVDRWRDAFASVSATIREINGADVGLVNDQDRDQKNTQLADSAPAFDFVVEGQSMKLNYQNIDQVEVRYYLMDIELLFSRNPFVKRFDHQAAYIRPNEVEVVKLAKNKATETIALPKSLASQNVLIEIAAAGETHTEPYFSNSLNVQLIENYGQLRVTAQGKPLAKTYVKTYARMRDGSVAFYKDGYTDLRGRFDYSTLSTSELANVEQFSVLVLSDEFGAVVAAPLLARTQAHERVAHRLAVGAAHHARDPARRRELEVALNDVLVLGKLRAHPRIVRLRDVALRRRGQRHAVADVLDAVGAVRARGDLPVAHHHVVDRDRRVSDRVAGDAVAHHALDRAATLERHVGQRDFARAELDVRHRAPRLVARPLAADELRVARRGNRQGLQTVRADALQPEHAVAVRAQRLLIRRHESTRAGTPQAHEDVRVRDRLRRIGIDDAPLQRGAARELDHQILGQRQAEALVHVDAVGRTHHGAVLVAARLDAELEAARRIRRAHLLDLAPPLPGVRVDRHARAGQRPPRRVEHDAGDLDATRQRDLQLRVRARADEDVRLVVRRPAVRARAHDEDAGLAQLQREHAVVARYRRRDRHVLLVDVLRRRAPGEALLAAVRNHRRDLRLRHRDARSRHDLAGQEVEAVEPDVLEVEFAARRLRHRLAERLHALRVDDEFVVGAARELVEQEAAFRVALRAPLDAHAVEIRPEDHVQIHGGLRRLGQEQPSLRHESAVLLDQLLHRRGVGDRAGDRCGLFGRARSARRPIGPRGVALAG